MQPMTDPEDRELGEDLWVDSQADLLRPTGCEDPDAVARALWLSDLQVVPLADSAPVDDRERVPEGWRVEWTMDPLHFGYEVPSLVPVSPSAEDES